MNRKSLYLSAALVAGFVAPMANALTVVPAAYVTGIVTAIDTAKGTISVDGVAYNATAGMLNDVTTGSQVDVTYLVTNGKLTALALERTDGPAAEEPMAE